MALLNQRCYRQSDRSWLICWSPWRNLTNYVKFYPWNCKMEPKQHYAEIMTLIFNKNFQEAIYYVQNLSEHDRLALLTYSSSRSGTARTIDTVILMANKA